MLKKNIFNKVHPICKECNGLGYVQGMLGSKAGCLFCNGDGNTAHGSRVATTIQIIKWCEDYIDGKKQGWYH
jgi:DnaJ-class molecular chaperone